ncbi:MAG: hypothetical protein AAF334_06750 [Pseudomonadota bacterium]
MKTLVTVSAMVLLAGCDAGRGAGTAHSIEKSETAVAAILDDHLRKERRASAPASATFTRKLGDPDGTASYCAEIDKTLMQFAIESSPALNGTGRHVVRLRQMRRLTCEPARPPMAGNT